MFFKFKKIQNINRQIHVLNMLQCVSPQHPTLSLFAIFVLSSLLVVQSLSCVRLFAVPWTAARQASLSFTNTKRLLRLMPTESVMPSSHLHLCRPLLLLPLSFLASGSFLESWLFTSDGQCIGASARLILSVEMIMATTCPSSWVYQNSCWGEEGEKGQPYLSTPQGEGKDRRERSSPFMPVSTSHVTSRFQNSKWMNIYKECIRRVWKIDWFPVYSSVQSLSQSDFLQTHESQHARPPCPSPAPGVYSNSCPSSRWCHPAISSSVIPFSSCPQSLPASGSFPMSQLFTSL